MQSEIVGQGLHLMLLGMGVVFVFLTLLVIATTLMSAFVQAYFPEPLKAAVEDNTNVEGVTNQPGLPDKQTLAVIKAALVQHRNR